MKAEKFEVKKDKYTKYFTGKIVKEKKGRVTIKTIRGEVLTYWREQILGSEPTNIEMQEEEDEKSR